MNKNPSRKKNGEWDGDWNDLDFISITITQTPQISLSLL